MAIKYFCDKCGKEVFKVDFYKVNLIFPHNNLEAELCQKCLDTIIEWLKQK
jgi:hypothetical protein